MHGCTHHLPLACVLDPFLTPPFPVPGQVFAPFMFKMVLHVLHTSFDDPAAPLPQRLAQHHELYNEMRQRCRDFLDGHPQ